jgi:hypothetical protein
MSPIVAVSPSDITGLLAYVGGLFEDFNVLILLMIGLPLGFWVIRKVVSLVRAR